MIEDELARWRAADAIFDGLLDLPAPEREAALAAMALEPAVVAHVHRLLQAHGRDDGPLDPAGPDARLEGRRIGRWVLEDEIGRGGMSVVYRARTDEGGETRVAAIKLLTIGALVAGGADRFRREQAILARLQHPHIASLVDCGVAEDGTPWLAMPLVEGEPIDAWCDSRGLGAAARVGLMLDVCDAVAYAHRNLVIHRDIKPSNVLVDREGYVRLLDFGIGGLLERRQAGMTLTRMLAWTPQYAAPEQFQLAPASTAMDVYGLGALLYRLLAGRPPREGRPDGEPLALPSRACREHGDAAPAQREAMARALRGDLDAIVLKALADDPDDRYRSPDALARDLKAWLHDRPVRARGAGNLYRLQCFLRRNRAVALVTAALALVLGSMLGATLWQAAQAERAAQRSAAARDLLASLVVPEDPGAAALASRDALAVAADRVRAEHAEPGQRAALLHLLGELQWRSGDAAGARAQLLEAQALGREARLPADERRASLALLGRIELEAGRGREAAEWLSRAQAEGRPAQAEALGLVSQRCVALALQGEAAATDDCIAEARRWLQGAPDPLAGDTLRALSMAELLLGRPRDALGHVDAAEARARAAGEAPGSRARTLADALRLLARAAQGEPDAVAATALSHRLPALADGEDQALAWLALAAQAGLHGDAAAQAAALEAFDARVGGAPPAPLARLRERALAPHTPP